MTTSIRLILIISSVFFWIFIIRRIRMAHIRIMDMFYWIAFSSFLAIMGFFPSIVISLSATLGFESPANFVFLVVIFLLMWKSFSLSIQLSEQKEKMDDAVEEICIDIMRNRK